MQQKYTHVCVNTHARWQWSFDGQFHDPCDRDLFSRSTTPTFYYHNIQQPKSVTISRRTDALRDDTVSARFREIGLEENEVDILEIIRKLRGSW